MLLFEFERGLLRLTLNTPALAALFQLPPQIGKRFDLFPIYNWFFCHGSLFGKPAFCWNSSPAYLRTAILYIRQS